jgi:acetyl esterase/lipase
MAAGDLVRVYPATNPTGAGLVWAHGGAFVHGTIDMPESDWVGRERAARGITVVSVDYRLTTESAHHYPAASDDMLSAWAWTRERADELGIHPRRLGIGGTSAGGNLAAGAVLRLQGRSASPALAVLAYPTLLAEQPAPSDELREKLLASGDPNRFATDRVRSMYEFYLGGPVENAPVPAVPGLASDEQLADFPPTIMINDDIDELRVSGEHFAARLERLGRDIEVHIEPGTTHGHLNHPDEGTAAHDSIRRIAERMARL